MTPDDGSLTLHPLSTIDAVELAESLVEIEPFRRLGFGPRGLTDYLLRPDPALARYRLDRDGVTVGVLALRHPWLRGPLVELLAVLPAAQGQGIGQAAIRWAAGQTGSANLWATVSAFNAAARRFYGRLGFVEVAPLPGLVAVEETEILLRLRR